MNLIVNFSKDSPEFEVAIYTCYLTMPYSYYSSLFMKSSVTSQITVTNCPDIVWFIRFLNSIF